MKTALVLYPHQLFAPEYLPEVDTIFLVEDPVVFGLSPDNRMLFHKQKLVLLRASMRRYAEDVLWPLGKKIEYIELDVLLEMTDVLKKLRKFDQVYMFELINEQLTERLLLARREMGDAAPAIEFLSHPHFYLKEHEVRQYFAARHVHPFEEFYQWQRERFNILLEDFKPVGGDWMLHKKSVSPSEQLPSFAAFGDNKWVEDAQKYVEKHFSQHPGSIDMIWPTSHSEAAAWLDDFVKHRLDAYAAHSEVFRSDAAWMYHSVLSVSLSIGLLSPQQVVEAALSRHQQRPVPLESLELFVRGLLGHREFMRGFGVVSGPSLKDTNPLRGDRLLTNAWYEGTTGLPVFDDLVKKLLAHGYIHNAERQMIVGTLMTICEIKPSEIRRWFSELLIDTQDWSLVPHIAALTQFAGKNTVGLAPTFCSSKTLIDNSDYQRGEWSNVWDGLYWRFVEKHRTEFAKHPKLRTVVHRLDRLDADQRRIMQYRAEDFLRTFTQ